MQLAFGRNGKKNILSINGDIITIFFFLLIVPQGFAQDCQNGYSAKYRGEMQNSSTDQKVWP